MGADNSVGHRCGDGLRDGAFQVTALGTGGIVFNLTEWKRDYIRFHWLPGTPGAVLYYGFFATEALADAGFTDLAASNANHDEVADRLQLTADWIEQGSDDETIPQDKKFLRLQPSAGVGRILVRQAEG